MFACDEENIKHKTVFCIIYYLIQCHDKTNKKTLTTRLLRLCKNIRVIISNYVHYLIYSNLEQEARQKMLLVIKVNFS